MKRGNWLDHTQVYYNPKLNIIAEGVYYFYNGPNDFYLVTSQSGDLVNLTISSWVNEWVCLGNLYEKRKTERK